MFPVRIRSFADSLFHYVQNLGFGACGHGDEKNGVFEQWLQRCHWTVRCPRGGEVQRPESEGGILRPLTWTGSLDPL